MKGVREEVRKEGGSEGEVGREGGSEVSEEGGRE